MIIRVLITSSSLCVLNKILALPMTALDLMVGILPIIQSAAKYLNNNESTIQTLRGALGDNYPT